MCGQGPRRGTPGGGRSSPPRRLRWYLFHRPAVTLLSPAEGSQRHLAPCSIRRSTQTAVAMKTKRGPRSPRSRAMEPRTPTSQAVRRRVVTLLAFGLPARRHRTGWRNCRRVSLRTRQSPLEVGERHDHLASLEGAVASASRDLCQDPSPLQARHCIIHLGLTSPERGHRAPDAEARRPGNMRDIRSTERSLRQTRGDPLSRS
jgi:hypothetical protein